MTAPYTEVTGQSYVYHVRIARPASYDADLEDEFDIAYENGVKRIVAAIDEAGYEVLDWATEFHWWSSDDAELRLELLEYMKPIDLEITIANRMERALVDAGLQEEGE